MTHNKRSMWWSSEGDGPLRSGPGNPQLSPGLGILEGLCRNGSLYAVEDRDVGKKYGKVEVNGGRIFINSFVCKKPEAQPGDRFITLRELLSLFNDSQDLFKTVFLKMTIVKYDYCADYYDNVNSVSVLDLHFLRTMKLLGLSNEEIVQDFHKYKHEESDRDIAFYGEPFFVVIETDGVSYGSENLRLICSGLGRHSFKDNVMIAHSGCSLNYHDEPFEHPYVPSYYQIESYYEVNEVEGGRDDAFMSPLKDGGVYGYLEYGDFAFEICLKDQPCYSLPQIGVVVAGLQDLKDRLGCDCFITECGLVI